MQRTIRQTISFDGVGLHSGKPARLVLRPAPAGAGIVFRRTDLDKSIPAIPALWDRVAESQLCTRLVGAGGASVATVEHVMAALMGCGIHNVTIEIDGAEVPILDGSAMPFVAGILAAGLVSQAAPVRAIRVLRPVEVSNGAARARGRARPPAASRPCPGGCGGRDGCAGSSPRSRGHGLRRRGRKSVV